VANSEVIRVIADDRVAASGVSDGLRLNADLEVLSSHTCARPPSWRATAVRRDCVIWLRLSSTAGLRGRQPARSPCATLSPLKGGGTPGG
jgi:hypothetical protein